MIIKINEINELNKSIKYNENEKYKFENGIPSDEIYFETERDYEYELKQLVYNYFFKNAKYKKNIEIDNVDFVSSGYYSDKIDFVINDKVNKNISIYFVNMYLKHIIKTEEDIKNNYLDILKKFLLDYSKCNNFLYKKSLIYLVSNYFTDNVKNLLSKFNIIPILVI